MSLHDAFEHAGKAGFAARNEKANCELSAAISFASSRDIIIRTRPRLFPRHADFKIPNTSRISYIILLRQARSLCIIIILLYFDVCYNEAPRRKARETFWLRELWRKFLMRFCSRCGPTKRAFSTSSGNGKQAEGSTKNYRETERSLWLKLIKNFHAMFSFTSLGERRNKKFSCEAAKCEKPSKRNFQSKSSKRERNVDKEGRRKITHNSWNFQQLRKISYSRRNGRSKCVVSFASTSNFNFMFKLLCSICHYVSLHHL